MAPKKATGRSIRVRRGSEKTKTSASASVRKRQKIAFEGAFHILSMETNREEVFDCISSWIVRRLGPRPPLGTFPDGRES
jgi:hypothetical protein